jgi:glutamate transport system permease protein
MSGATVLYDAPGPRARARYRWLGVLTAAVGVLIVGGLLFLMIDTDQFSAGRLAQFQYVEVQRALLNGYLATLKAAGIATVLALLLGAVLATGRRAESKFIRGPSVALVEFFRAVPLLILIFFFYYGSLEYGLGLSPMWAVVLGLTLYNGSVLAEIFRAGIAAVPRGQSEAAFALGLSKGQVMRQVLLPQAVRSMLPSIISQLVVLLKDTALGFIVTYNELLYIAKQIGGRGGAFDFPYVVTYLIVAIMYIATCVALSLLASWLERRSRRSPRGAPPTEDLPAASIEVQAPTAPARTGA